MKYKKTIICILITLIFLLSWYFYKGYSKEDSYILIFPKTTKSSQIIHDMKLLSKNKYHFVDQKMLKRNLDKNKPFLPKTTFIGIDGMPTDELTTFFKANNIPATFFITSKQAPLVRKYKLYKNISFGLKPVFAKTKEKFLKSGYLSINFDDGWESVYENALPILKKESVPVSVFVIVNPILEDNPLYLSAVQIQELQSEGFEIGSHSVGHEDFETLGKQEALDSMASSKNFLLSLGLYIQGFSFPLDRFNDDSLAMAKQYYDYFRLASDNYNYSNQIVVDSYTVRNNYPLSWFKKKISLAKKKKVGVIFLFHKVDNGPDEYNIQITKFKKAIKIMKKSGLPIYSNIGLLGKPLFLRQENGKSLESELDYVKRLRVIFREQKSTLEFSGIKTNVLLYPEGVVTDGLQKAARLEGFQLGLGATSGYLKNNLDSLDLKTLTLKEGILKKALTY